MSGDGAADHILDGSFGFNLSNAVLKLIDSEHNLHADGQTIISDGTFVIGTNASKKLIFSTDDTERIQITTDGALDILSQKLLINGNAGTSGQMLTTDGFGNISWSTPVTQENAFKTLAVSGQSNVVADQAGDTLNIAAGTGISITTNAGTDTLTITNTNTSAGSEAFRTIVAGGTTIQADNNTDTLTLTPGSNVTFTVDSNDDSITINANTDGELNQNAFTQVQSTNQNTLSADSTSAALKFNSENNTSVDSRYDSDRDKVTVTTDTSTNEVKVTNNVPKTFSMASKIPIVMHSGATQGMPLRNKFFNVATTDPVSGGGSSVGVSTRSIPILKSDGSTSDVLMPAKTDNSTLQLTVLNTSGSNQTMDMEVAE
jgi:hypothetical protein|tara:strand:+ start:1734 stop:2852 length:1119 start_codon:yes stop_codon:yes gene_type:complete